jgi:hypothetical protein
MSVPFLIEDVKASTASSDDLVSGSEIARRAAICSIAASLANPAGIPPPAPAGFKPELACLHLIGPLSRTSLPRAETGWC